MIKWIEETLEEVCIKVTDGAHKSPKAKDKGHYMVSVKDFLEYGFDFSNCKLISDEDYDNLERSGCVPEKGDILVGKDGARFFEDVIIYEQDEKPALLSSIAIIRCNIEKIDPYYLYYIMKLPNVRKDVRENYGSGSAIPRIVLKDFKRMPIKYPSDKKIQEDIVSLLKNIDSKIKVNTQINRNLQEQLDAIYRDRFITNQDASWEDGHLSDLITVKYGKDHKKLEDGTIPCYGSGGVMRMVEKPLYDQESVLIPRKGTLNNVMYVNEPFWSVDTMFFTIMKKPNVAKFVFHFVKSRDLAAMNAGSAVPSMTTEILNAMEVKIPSEDILFQFEEDVQPMYKALKDNEYENKRLSELRDALLPKLMSGELDVSDLDI